jgi:two-component system, chemotaxis family, protein-glutamate methylesterase/glutaminase
VSSDALAFSPERQRAAAAAVVIGGSAGSVDALLQILPVLTRGFALPVMIVVHVPPTAKSALPEVFEAKCALRVKEAEDKEPIHGGVVYFAAADYHLLVEPNRTLSFSNEEPVLFSRPAIDLLFESAADAYGGGLVGVVLTGASSDGARGLAAICQAGGRAIVQDPETALAPTMPEAALAACPGARTLSLPEIGQYLRELCPAP